MQLQIYLIYVSSWKISISNISVIIVQYVLFVSSYLRLWKILEDMRYNAQLCYDF